MTRAKFTVTSKTRIDYPGGSHSTVINLQAVTSGSEENKVFFDSTPTGQMTLTTVSQASADSFEPGKEYYVDFTLAS